MNWRWPWAVLAVAGLAVIVVVQLRGPGRLIAWLALGATAMLLVGWGSWPPRPAPRPLLGEGADVVRSRSPRSLADIELDVAAAADPRLRGADRLRARLDELGRRRGAVLDLGSAPMMTVEEIEEGVAWIERR